MQNKLDILLLYLRRVHAFCLYCGEEYEDERMLSTRCGPQHIRSNQKILDDEFNEILGKDKEPSGSKPDETKQELTPEESNPEGTRTNLEEKFKQISKLG